MGTQGIIGIERGVGPPGVPHEAFKIGIFGKAAGALDVGEYKPVAQDGSLPHLGESGRVVVGGHMPRRVCGT